MSQQQHIIGKTVLEIEIDRLDEAWSFQAEVSDIFKQQGIPTMERLFDRLVGVDRTIRLDRVVLDLRPIDRHFLADEFVRNLLDALDRTLSDLLLIATAETKIQSRTGADWEVFLYFLEYGRLPWWCPTTDWQTWLPIWETVMQTGNAWQSPLRTLLTTYQSAQQRLVFQFPPSFRHQLILQLQPTWLGWSNLLTQAQQLIQALGCSRSISRQLETQAWLSIFTELVQTPSSSRPLPTHEWILAWLTSLIQILQPSIVPTTAPIQPPATLDLDPIQRRRDEIDRVSPQTLAHQKLRTLLAGLPSAERSLWLAEFDRLMPLPRWQDSNDEQRAPRSIRSINPTTPTSKVPSRSNDLASAAIDRTADPASQASITTPEIDGADASSQISPPIPTNEQTPVSVKIQRLSDPQIAPEEATAGIFIKNCGLVILHPFLPMYFAEVGLLNGEAFQDETAQQTAIYLLHYLATGQIEAPEAELVMPKLLCGLHLNAPMQEIELSPSALTEGDHLLQTAIDYWQVLKSTSPDGLREGFLQRKGKLTYQDDGNWRLQVEQQSIDILLGSLPWGLNVIKLPWLESLLMVEWS